MGERIRISPRRLERALVWESRNLEFSKILPLTHRVTCIRPFPPQASYETGTIYGAFWGRHYSGEYTSRQGSVPSLLELPSANKQANVIENRVKKSMKKNTVG